MKSTESFLPAYEEDIMLTVKKVTLGVTGSIAAYKMANVASMLVKMNCDVHVVMTKSATEFIAPLTFETLTKNPCLVEAFERRTPVDIHHLTLGQTSDLILVAPASADILGKMACGIADDLLTSSIIAASCPVLAAPAMNVKMYQNPIVQENIRRLRSFWYEFIEPETGRLACEAVGVGKLPEESVLVDAVLHKLAGKEKGRCRKDLEGVRILVTAGPTRESLDPVRFLTNHSTGKMGYAVAGQAQKRGARVTLITGPVSLSCPKGVEAVFVTTAEEMYREVMERAEKQDIIIKAAAVADYRPKQISPEKMKKQEGQMLLELERTKDILLELGREKRKDQCICGFSMETEEALPNSRMKLKKKNADMIAANSLRENGAGFGGNTNHLVLITENGEEDTGMLTKEACADRLLDRLYEIWKQKQN